jgi:hypothetical protein
MANWVRLCAAIFEGFIRHFDEHFRKARYTDSVLTNGKPFSPIPKDSLEIANSRMANSCALKLSSGRAPNMFMKNPAQAPDMMEKI